MEVVFREFDDYNERMFDYPIFLLRALAKKGGIQNVTTDNYFSELSMGSYYLIAHIFLVPDYHQHVMKIRRSPSTILPQHLL